jgi:hypothetical protein
VDSLDGNVAETRDQAAEAVQAAPAVASWTPLTNQPQFAAGLSLLLTDGSLMVQDVGSPNWWKLTPDASGNYINGTWTQLASMPDGYSPLYFASAVLPDGRVIIEGGEYQNFTPTWGNQGAIYDPKTDTWTPVAPPDGWQTIGDAQSVVLANGQFVLANCCTTEAAIFDPNTLTWTPTGTGKADINDEEGWTLLPKGTVLTVDANNTDDLLHSELYTPAHKNQPATWTSAGSTVVQLGDLNPDGSGSHEVGPAMLRPNGTVFYAGATGHTSIYRASNGQWTPGPDFPTVPEGQLDVADGAAALLPNGNVLIGASPLLFSAPLYFFEFDGANLNPVVAPPNAPFDTSFVLNMLVLPSGQIMLTDFSGDIEIYTPTGKAQSDWAPEITTWDLNKVHPGQTYKIEGNRLNGLSQAVAYGDDAQAATNYPLVRLKNKATGHVSFARTHDHSSMSVAKDQHSKTFFDVPAGQETGETELVVIANGIPSKPISIRVQ